MIGRRSGPDYSPFKEHGLFEDRLADFETIRDDFASLDDWGYFALDIPHNTTWEIKWIVIAMSSNSVLRSSH